MIDETYICSLVIEMLSKDRDVNKFGIEERSSSYLSLVYCDNDFFKVKYTPKAKWISIRLAKEDMNKDDERFKAQLNKNQLYWKADIDSEQDILKFKNELLNACKCFTNDTYTPRGNNHSRITIGYNFETNQIVND